MRELYSILGLSRSASDADVKKAYRALAKKYHPDRNKDNPAAAEKFKEISAAYAILGDEKQRGRYDRGEIDASGAEKVAAGADFGSGFGSGFPFGSRTGGRARTRRSEDFDTGEAEDLFSDFWRFAGGFNRGGGRKAGGRSTKGRNRGIDINYEITIGFEESITGSTRRITLNDGRSLDVKIPAGIQEGQVIRLSGQGGPGMGGAPKGDAMISVHVSEHPYFRREGLDIHLELPITLDEAILGGDVEVPTPRGHLTIRIPASSSSGRRLRLKDKGIKKGNSCGHMYVTLKVILPSEPDSGLEELIKNWRGGGQGDLLRRGKGLK